MDTPEFGILVGVDDSEGGWQALDWAAADAATLGTRLTVVRVHEGWELPALPESAEVRAIREREDRRILSRAVSRAQAAAPDVAVESLLATGHAAGELVRLAGDADEVVLGSRGRGGFSALLLGSVSAHVATHAATTTVIVRGRPAPDGPVVIGVDGSEAGEPALRYGFAHAARHQLRVVAVHAYEPVDGTGDAPLPGAKHLLEDAVSRWVRRWPRVEVETVLAPGRAAARLVADSAGASLLVVGSRGHGGFPGVLLGSVGHTVLLHAHSPVAIARTEH